jgi:hypothetical protein
MVSFSSPNDGAFDGKNIYKMRNFPARHDAMFG